MDEENKFDNTPPNEETPTETPAPEEIPEEPTEESPETPSKPSTSEPAPENPALVAEAEAEAPAETKPVFETPVKKKKSHAPLLGVVAILLVATLGVVGYFAFPNALTNSSNSSNSQNNSETQLETAPDPEVSVSPINASLSDFDLTFLKLENDGANKVYSPLSIKYALAMLKDGADGDTKTQIENLIGDYVPKAYLNSANRSLANALFIKNDFSEKIKTAYVDGLKTKYNAEVLYDELVSPLAVNNWVEERTIGIIKNLIPESSITPTSRTEFVLVNALAIDMAWGNRLQCVFDSDVTDAGINCKSYGAYFPHENFSDSVRTVDLASSRGFDKITFNGSESEAAEIAVSANRYDVIAENGGDEAVRSLVQEKYNDWLAEVKVKYSDCPDCYSEEFDIEDYMTKLGENHNRIATSTDFYFLDTDSERVFAKDLKEYDGSTFQYIGIMPKITSLNDYVSSLTAKKVSELISSTKPASEASSYKEGVLTHITAHIPFFKFGESLKLVDDLKALGVTNVFDEKKANLTNITDEPGIFITDALHKADIDFSNDGIKAAAATAFVGGMGAGGFEYFDYKFDVPVEEIDFTFNKPFLFLIVEKNSGEPWFVGTVYEPTEE